MSEQPGLVEFYCTTAVRTSAGCALGAKMLPPDEAARLHASKLGVYGHEPPRGYEDGGNPASVVAASRVFGGHLPRPDPTAVSN